MISSQTSNAENPESFIVIETVHGNVTSISTTQLRSAVAGRFEGKLQESRAEPSQSPSKKIR
ncbi:MAG: hypothetical protein AAFV88_25815 [Planctomycetota bacterium]